MDKIAEFLIEKETITGKEFMQIFNEAEGITEDNKPAEASRINEKPTVIEMPERTEMLTQNVEDAVPESETTENTAEVSETENAEEEKTADTPVL
jgi:cell division protease FtsH